ncbi:MULTISPECIES: NgrC [Gammaproteobacteria]|uniref:NgrC n=2 Tax=Gammaproteobacteria TaxID=1236 RepID=A0AAX3P1M4_9GAMM|nr:MULTISPECIES: NgrC [Gammaproteobacteria]MDV0844429.1 NgrC [Klebsiella quasipneumoniae subsp. quasipneumoniae]WED79215.1 NgrC [Aeromonas allosaccharophila]
MIKQHFQNELVKHGYPADLTIEYSLGYCQGDGMAFYGSLGVDDVQALMKRLFGTEQGSADAVRRVKNLMAQKDIDHMINVLRDYGNCDLSITRNSFGQHYSHWNTMRIDSNVDFTGVFPDEETMLGTGIEGINPEMLERWQGIWDRFIDALQDDVKSLSKRLEADGYKLIEATPYEETVVWQRTTESYQVRVIELPEHEFDMDDWDADCRDQTIRDLLDGSQRVLGLRVEVRDHDGDYILADNSMYGLTLSIDDKKYDGYRREMLRDVITQVRLLNDLKAA